jgi:tripartite-type tricarboxylate transporter receptor subunit TctC
MKRRDFMIATAASATLTPLASLRAQAKYPQRPITLIVPTAPGGSTDFTARLIAEPLSKALGQPVVVDNKPGASGNIGNQLVARSKPDGYTLLISYSGYHVANPHLFKQAGWDPIKDFAPVAMLTRAPQVIAASLKLPANSTKELIAYGKANPGRLNYASSGNGSIQHIAGELLGQMTGMRMTHIPYRGAGPAVQDLISGEVDLLITTPAAVVSYIQAGRVKGLAVTSTQRLSVLPNMPTANESGLQGYELDSWFALFAPAGTPPEIVKQLNAEVNKILQMTDVRKKADESGTGVETMSPTQLGDFTLKELDRWGKVIKSAQIKLD